MPMKKMWVEWEDGADLSQSRKKPGGYSPLTRDEDNNLGQVVLSDVDDDEGDWQAESEPVYPYGTGETASGWQAEEEPGLEELLTVLALGIVVAQKAAPHLRRWWDDQAVPFLEKSRNRITRGRRAKEQVVLAEPSSLAHLLPRESSPEVFAALEEYRASMSSAEARERFVAALVARLFSDEQLRVLRNARIEDEGPALDLAAAMETLTPHQLAESITLMLETNPSWPDDQTLAELGKILGRGSRGDGEHVPMSARIDEALRLPGTAE